MAQQIRNDRENGGTLGDVAGLTPSQAFAADQLLGFLASNRDQAFVLKGYAGTGKTYLLARLASELAARQQPFFLLAPTGRAARVLREATGFPAGTLHSHIYALDHLEAKESDEGRHRYRFTLHDNKDPDNTVYILDEASLIADAPQQNEYLQFGSGRPLADLLAYVFGGNPRGSRRRVIFCGDPAQLPPVMDSQSVALHPAELRARHKLDVAEAELVHVVRQAEGSPILELATRIRDRLRENAFDAFEINPAAPALIAVGAAELEPHLPNAPSRTLNPPEMIITHSNRRASLYNEAVRARLFPGATSVQPGDRLLVTANCHRDDVHLLNGDFVLVDEVSPNLEVVEQPLPRTRPDGSRELIRLAFRRVVLRVLNDRGEEKLWSTLMLENLLESCEREPSREELQALFLHFVFRHRHLHRNKPAFLKALQADPYFNALRAKYAYAITCHRAQGAEWPKVIVDMQTAMNPATESFFRWAYTAVSRARSQLILVDPPRLFAGIPARLPDPGTLVLPDRITVDTARRRPHMPSAWYGTSPFHLLLACHLFDCMDAAGVQIADLRHHAYHVDLSVEKAGQTARFHIFYNARESVSRVLALPGSHPELAQLMLDKLTLLQGRSFVESEPPAADQQPDDSPQAPPAESAPFPAPAGHPAMARFDEHMRTRIAPTHAIIARIEILNPYQVRYILERGASRAALLFYFNGKGCCTAVNVDARRTTDASLAAQIFAALSPTEAKS